MHAIPSKPHSVPAGRVLDGLESSESGLDSREAESRLKHYGPNELERHKRTGAIEIFISQFKSALIIVLLVAAAVSFALGETLDASAMVAIVLLTAVMGFVQEYRAEKAMEALQKISAPVARVLRNGEEARIPSREVVPGDVLLLEAGDIVPADSRIYSVSSLEVDESMLTGESFPSGKFTEHLKEETSVSDQENMAFAGTIVTRGKGRAVVTGTGVNTEFGKIATLIQSQEETKTPLQVKFERMAKQLAIAVLALVAIVFVSGVLRGASYGEMLLFSLSLAVAAVPNSLPAIVTISLAFGANELARHKMIIRKLPATESLGSVTVICSDKTGTITKNEMTVTRLHSGGKEYFVSGTGYEPKGEFSIGGKKANAKELEKLLQISTLCNNSKLYSEAGKWKVTGDPTEGALAVLAEKGGFGRDKARGSYDIVQELPFDSERKAMTVIAKDKASGKKIALVKGAPDLLLEKCDRILANGKVDKITQKERREILAANDSFAESALRVLGFAYTEEIPAKPTAENTERNLVFVGLAGMIDPPRDEVIDAVAKTRHAGIRVVVITGDHALTTKAVARKIGLFKEGDLVMTGDELDLMTDEQLASQIDDVVIFARTLPIQKSRIVDALKKKGHIVAMTGDGVNDAPAIKKADVGISMGITGTDVAKEVSKATLVDDNFATIVNGIAEGRNIYDKIIKSTRYLLSCNMGEISIIMISIFASFPLPLIPMQILMMNLLTDGLPALGLGFEKAESEAMKRPPRNPKDNPLSGRMVLLIALFGIAMGLGSFLLFANYLGEGLQKAQTVAFTTLVMFELFAAVASRSLYPFHRLNLFSNKWLVLGIASSIALQLLVVYWAPLQPVFGTVPLGAGDWVNILAVASLGFVVMELSKFLLHSGSKTGLLAARPE